MRSLGNSDAGIQRGASLEVPPIDNSPDRGEPTESGDEPAEPFGTHSFDELIARYDGLIRAVVRRVCGRFDGFLGEDSAQEARLATWRHLEGGNRILHPYSFLVKVATSAALRALRRHAAASELPGHSNVRDVEGGGSMEPHVNDEIGQQLRNAVDRGLERLSAKRRRAVEAYLCGLNHLEVARLLELSPSAARHDIYKGLATLREFLRGEGFDLDES